MKHLLSIVTLVSGLFCFSESGLAGGCEDNGGDVAAAHYRHLVYLVLDRADKLERHLSPHEIDTLRRIVSETLVHSVPGYFKANDGSIIRETNPALVGSGKLALPLLARRVQNPRNPSEDLIEVSRGAFKELLDYETKLVGVPTKKFYDFKMFHHRALRPYLVTLVKGPAEQANIYNTIGLFELLPRNNVGKKSFSDWAAVLSQGLSRKTPQTSPKIHNRQFQPVLDDRQTLSFKNTVQALKIVAAKDDELLTEKRTGYRVDAVSTTVNGEIVIKVDKDRIEEFSAFQMGFVWLVFHEIAWQVDSIDDSLYEYSSQIAPVYVWDLESFNQAFIQK